MEVKQEQQLQLQTESSIPKSNPFGGVLCSGLKTILSTQDVCCEKKPEEEEEEYEEEGEDQDEEEEEEEEGEGEEEEEEAEEEEEEGDDDEWDELKHELETKEALIYGLSKGYNIGWLFGSFSSFTMLGGVALTIGVFGNYVLSQALQAVA